MRIFESYCMVLQYKVGGIFLLRLNISDRPIGNKYLEGKLKRTLKRELKLPETVVVEGLTWTFVGVGWYADPRPIVWW